MPTYPIDYTAKQHLAAWRWQTRHGLGPAAGTTSIHNYQNGHAAAERAICRLIERELGAGNEPVAVRVKGDFIEADSTQGWVKLARVADVWRDLRW